MASVGVIVWDLFAIFDFPVSPATEMHVSEYGQIWPIWTRHHAYINITCKNTNHGVVNLNFFTLIAF